MKKSISILALVLCTGTMAFFACNKTEKVSPTTGDSETKLFIIDGGGNTGGCTAEKVGQPCPDDAQSCCYRIRSAYPGPYVYRFECRACPTGSVSGIYAGIDLTLAEKAYSYVNIYRHINSTTTTVGTNVPNSLNGSGTLVIVDDQAPSGWESETVRLEFKFYNSSDELISTEDYYYYP